jgi:hypothetical protein
VQGQWCLGDDKRILLNFGSQEVAAHQALATIKRYGFTRVGVVGRQTPLMLLFLAGGYAPAESVGPLGLNGTTGPQPASPAERLSFDSHQLQVRRRGNDWQLAMGHRVLANFGPNEAEARHAREVLRQYRCTEQIILGRPRPVLAYYLANGQAPKGTMLGLRSLPFHPESLEIRQVGTTNVLCDGNQVVMRLDDRLPEAQEVLQTIRHYRFDRLSHIGPDGGGLTLLIRTR